jgi:CHAT domain-containing protein
MKISQTNSIDREGAVDAILRWIALRPPRWAAQLAVHLAPSQSPQNQSALQTFLDPFDPGSREQITRALAAGRPVLLPLVNHQLVSLTKEALSQPAKILEGLMELTWSRRPKGGNPANASSQEVENLLLFTILTIERNWNYPVDVTDFDPDQLGYPKQFFSKILELIFDLERFDWRPSLPDRPHPAFPDDLLAQVPVLRLRLLASYTLGRFLHDAVLLHFIEDSVNVQRHLNEFVIDFALYRTIYTALSDLHFPEDAIYWTIAAEAVEMLASLQMRNRSEVFPVDYVTTSQLLKDNRLASKVAKAGAFDDLISKPTGYMLKRAPLIRFKREPTASEELLELPHPIHFFINAIARDIPPGIAYLDFTIAAGGLCVIVATATGSFGAFTARKWLQGRRLRDLISGQVHELRRCTAEMVPHVLPPRDGTDSADAVWIETALTYGFDLDDAGRWVPFGSDARTYISRNEWRAALSDLFAALFGKLRPTLDEHKITHLVINPDRSLNLLPFPLLRDAKGNLLFDHNRISLVPSLPHFINALLRSNLDQRRAWNRILILADNHSAATDFAIETKLIGSVFADREVLVHTTKDFDEAAFTREAERADILHVCTHAKFDARKPHESGVSIGQDRWFDLPAMARLRLQRHSIVFLGACETGVLEVSDRFNRASIAQNVLDAGAGSVVATQWKVDGTAMALLAFRFYELLLKPDCPGTLDALVTAQNWVRTCRASEAEAILGTPLLTTEDVPFADDFFWAAANLWGCWV